jgi:hypothetical protein
MIKMIIASSRKKCPFYHTDDPPFVSLADYRNNYFTSDDPYKIIEFYNGFENRDQLIQWMKERPKGVANIHEVDGDRDIIVVIPTADFNGKYAKECRENIFKGLHIVFVESGEIPDPYFNGAHNVNIGIKKAMEYNPKWVVFSNDDMIKMDSVNILKDQLMVLDNKEYDVVFTKPSNYHSSWMKISRRNSFYNIYYSIANKQYSRFSIGTFEKFRIKYFMSPITGKFSKLFKIGYEYLEIQDFGIYSSRWISENGEQVYDETFINGAEDTDLSLKFSFNKERIAIIDYKIGDLIGSTIKNGSERALRSIAGMTYLNYKWTLTLDRVEKEND